MYFQEHALPAVVVAHPAVAIHCFVTIVDVPLVGKKCRECIVVETSRVVSNIYESHFAILFNRKRAVVAHPHGLHWKLNGGDTVDGNALALHLVFKIVQRLVAVVSNGHVGGYLGTADDVGDDISKVTGPSDKKGLLGFPLGWRSYIYAWISSNETSSIICFPLD